MGLDHLLLRQPRERIMYDLANNEYAQPLELEADQPTEHGRAHDRIAMLGMLCFSSARTVCRWRGSSAEVWESDLPIDSERTSCMHLASNLDTAGCPKKRLRAVAAVKTDITRCVG